MANLSKPKRLQTWDKAETFLKLHLSEDKFYHYSHEWPERLTVNELAALQAMDSDILFSTWKYLISNSGMPVIIDSVRTVAGSGERSKGRNRSSSVFLQFPVIFEAPNMELETISPSDFADFLRQEGEEPSECIRDWFDAFGIVALQAKADEDDDTGNQKQSELHHFIWRVRLSLIERKKRHTWLDVWREIENNHTQHDLDKIIQEVMNGVIFWCSSGGTEQKLKKTSLCKTITGLKKKPPF